MPHLLQEGHPVERAPSAASATRPGHRHRPRSAARVEVGNELCSTAAETMAVVSPKRSPRARPHGAPIAGVRGRGPGEAPVRPRRESCGGRAGARTGPHVFPALKQRGQAARECFGVQPPASATLSSSSRASWVSSLYWPNAKSGWARSPARPARDTGRRTGGPSRTGGFDHEPEGVAQGLPQYAAGEGPGSRSHHARTRETQHITRSIGEGGHYFRETDRVGFEPTIPLRVYRFSRPAPSATRTPVLGGGKIARRQGS